MDLIFKPTRSEHKGKTSVSDYVKTVLTRTYEDGVAEQAVICAEKCADAIGQLVEILADKGLLNKDDIDSIALSGNTIVELVKTK